MMVAPISRNRSCNRSISSRERARRHRWCNPTRPRARTDTIEQLVSIADRRHAQGGEQSFVELTCGTKVAHAQYDMRHAVNLDFGIRHN